MSARVIISLDWGQPFEVMCDTSRVTLGAVLKQTQDKILHPIDYFRKALNLGQKGYTVTGQELLVVVFTFEKFWS